MKDKGFIFTFIIYLVLFIGDFISTFATGPVKEHLEINPLFMISKSWWLIIIINIIVIILLWYSYKHKTSNPTNHFVIINTMVVVIMARIVAIQRAIYWIKNPITIEAAQKITTAVKVEAVKQFAIMTYAPLFLTLIVYFIWRCDHDIKIK